VHQNKKAPFRKASQYCGINIFGVGVVIRIKDKNYPYLTEKQKNEKTHLGI
jgi:hypothetical protein